MTRTLDKSPKAKALRLAGLLAACGLLVLVLILVLVPAPARQDSAAAHAADNFSRPNGSLGRSWTSIRDGRLSISSHAVTGHNGLAGDIWTAGTFARNQYSQIEVSSKQLTTDQWIGAAVRVRNGGRDAYVGIYYWNSGRPELQLFKRTAGTWFQLGAYKSQPLTAGTQLKLVAIGSAIVFLENGVLRLSAADTSISAGIRGTPGIMIYGAG